MSREISTGCTYAESQKKLPQYLLGVLLLSGILLLPYAGFAEGGTSVIPPPPPPPESAPMGGAHADASKTLGLSSSMMSSSPAKWPSSSSGKLVGSSAAPKMLAEQIAEQQSRLKKVRPDLKDLPSANQAEIKKMVEGIKMPDQLAAKPAASVKSLDKDAPRVTRSPHGKYTMHMDKDGRVASAEYFDGVGHYSHYKKVKDDSGSVRWEKMGSPQANTMQKSHAHDRAAPSAIDMAIPGGAANAMNDSVALDKQSALREQNIPRSHSLSPTWTSTGETRGIYGKVEGGGKSKWVTNVSDWEGRSVESAHHGVDFTKGTRWHRSK